MRRLRGVVGVKKEPTNLVEAFKQGAGEMVAMAPGQTA